MNMTKMKSTKRALVMSALSLLLCVSMLIGSTYAWFTDSVVSGSNVITSGNLDLEVQYTLDGKNWADLAGATDLFSKGLWEPGHTEVVALKIENKGSLALKYVASMNIFDETVGKNKDGGDIVLSDILTVSSVTQQANQIGDILLGLVFGGSQNTDAGAAKPFKSSNIFANDQELLPGEAHYAIITVDMAEIVGNEANHDGVNVPSIEFGLNVLATQYTYENDSFGNQYDKDATYPVVGPEARGYDEALVTAGWDGTYPTEQPATFVLDESAKTITIKDEAAFAYLYNFMKTDESKDGLNAKYPKILLDADLNLGAQPWTPMSLSNYDSFDGQGHTISNLYVADATAVQAGLFKSVGNGQNGKTVVKNFTVYNAYVEGKDQVAVVIGAQNCHLVDNVHVDRATVIAESNGGGIVGRSYGAVSNSSLKNSVVTGGKRTGGISGFANSNNADTLVFTNNYVENVELTGYRIGSLIGQSASGKIAITVSDSTAKDVDINLTVAGEAAGELIGNNTASNGALTVVENCTATKVKIK